MEVFILSLNIFRHLTFTDMENRVITCTAGLRKIGIQRGDKVALLNEAGWEWVTLNFGIQYIGKNKNEFN
jgi:long-subunit acyl-CoA synthetase (AMP-forming)